MRTQGTAGRRGTAITLALPPFLVAHPPTRQEEPHDRHGRDVLNLRQENFVPANTKVADGYRTLRLVAAMPGSRTTRLRVGTQQGYIAGGVGR
jgi:hypothetical protein